MTGPYTIRIAPSGTSPLESYSSSATAKTVAETLAATLPKQARVLVMGVVNADLHSGPLALAVPFAFFPGTA